MRRTTLVLAPALIVLMGGATWASLGPSTDPGDTVEAQVAEARADLAAGPSAARATRAATGPAPDGCETPVSDTRDITRISGPDRYTTAACASGAGYADGAATVVLARGDADGGYADALAGTVLAHHVDGPVLLTRPDELPDVTATEIRRLGAENVVLLGGEVAISTRVEQQVQDLGVTTERVAGDDRAETAALVSARGEATSAAFVVNGRRPADALVAGAVAARAGAALLLVDERGVPDPTADALQGVDRVTIVGGHAVVPTQVEEAIRAIVPNVTRLSGPTRDETAASVARALPTDGTVHVVSGADGNLVDAIAAGWLAAQPGGGPVVYAQPSTPGRGTDRYLRIDGLRTLPAIRVIGGESILGPDLVDALEARLGEAEAGGVAPQTRAMWVHLFDGSLKTREAIARTLDTAAAHNLNTVIAQVVRRHDSYSTSDVLPRTTDPTLDPDLDLLAELTTQARARGLELHAWFAIAPAYHGAYDEPGLPAEHVYRQHGPGTSDSWMTYDDTGLESSTYLDVGVPAVRDHVVAMIGEVAQRYDVDAVHLDYPRYPEHRVDGAGVRHSWGYNPRALDVWRSEGSPDFDDWRRAQTEKLAKAVKDAVTAARPGTLVTMAAIAQGDGPAGVGGFQNTRAYAQVFQDWAGWLARDVVDAAFPMAYFREDNAEYRTWYDHWVQFAAELAPTEHVAVGQAAFLNRVNESIAQLNEGLVHTDGVVIYSYQQDTKCPAGRTDGGSPCSPVEPHGTLFDALLGSAFAGPAPAR